MPDDFIVVAETEKVVLSTQFGGCGKVTERLYTNQRTYDKMDERQKRLISQNSAVQMTIEDFLKQG